MATTIPQEFTGTPTLTPEKVEAIKDWYLGALGDSDKADDPEDGAFYTGQHEAYSDVLALLFAQTPVSAPSSTTEGA